MKLLFCGLSLGIDKLVLGFVIFSRIIADSRACDDQYTPYDLAKLFFCIYRSTASITTTHDAGGVTHVAHGGQDPLYVTLPF